MYRIMHALEWRTVGALTRVHKQFVSTVHTLFYILHNGPIHDDNKTSYIDFVSRYLCRGSADDVTIY